MHFLCSWPDESYNYIICGLHIRVVVWTTVHYKILHMEHFTLMLTEMMLHLLHLHSAYDKRRMTRKWSWKKRIWKWLEPLSSNMVTVRSLCSTQNQCCGCRIRFVYLLPCLSAITFNSWEPLCPSQHWTQQNIIVLTQHTKYN